MVTTGTSTKGEYDLGSVGAKTKVKAAQEHPKDQKIKIAFNNIENLNLKFQKYVQKTSATYNNDRVSR
jgi:hypothetical protein